MEKSNTDLVHDYLAGDPGAFDLLVKQNLSQLYNFIYHLSGNADEAHDIAQEVFVKVWKHMKKYDPKQNFKTWLFSIARNTTIDHFRKKKAIPFGDMQIGDETIFEDGLADTELLPDAVFEQKELGKFLDEALATLPLEERSIVLLHDKEDFTFEEIAAMLKKPMNTVKSRYRRAIIAFRKRILAPKEKSIS